MKQLKFCTTLLLFISGILALRGIKPALFLLLAFAGLREIISAKEYQDAGEKKYAIASLSAGIFLFVFLMVIFWGVLPPEGYPESLSGSWGTDSLPFWHRP